MRRVDPASLVFIAALVGSLGFHFPVYEALGVLADRLMVADELAAAARSEEAGANVPLDLVFEPLPAEAPVTDDPARPSQVVPSRPEAEHAQRPEPEPEPEPEVTPPEAPRPRPEPASAEHAVTQRSRDPNVEPPPDARFVAEENNRVEEETLARERSLTQDAPEPSPAGSEEPSQRQDDPGDREDELAQAEDREGEEGRSSQEAAAAATPSQPERRAQEASRGPAGGGGTPSRSGGGADTRYETVTIRDGSGSFVIRRPRGQGAGQSSGVASLGPGGRRNPGERGPGAGTGPTRTPNLRMGFSQLEEVIGADVLAEERQAYTEQRRSRRRGTDHAAAFREFRAAIENFVPNVRPGNQTALNARASPFAAYTAEVHRRLHMPFHEFVAGVGSRGDLADPSLETKLEIVLERDGSVHQIGVVRTSGKLLFDQGAYAAVRAGAPYPVAPDAILSGDGRIYLRWTFKAAEPYCHPIHSERFILDNGPDSRSGAAPAPSRGSVTAAAPTP